MEDENVLDFNFWPSFSDLMLSLVLILVLVLFLVAAVLNVGTIDLSHVEKNQEQVIRDIAYVFGVKPMKMDDSDNVYRVSNGRGDVFIKNEPTFQKITFSSNILFGSDEIRLNEKGRDALWKVGNILKRNLEIIREIQIQGHADTNPSKRYRSNMQLAAMRAISVFNFLKDDLNIDPAGHLISITSFGEFKPVQRSEEDDKYSPRHLKYHNQTMELKERNRRIELLLFYRYRENGSKETGS